MIEKFSDYVCFLPISWHLLFLIHGTILVGILLSRYSFLDVTYKVWNDIGVQEKRKIPWGRIFILFSVFCLILIAYFSEIPFQKTGLYHVLISSPEQPAARELSLKNMDNGLVRYAYALVKNALAPTLFLLLFIFSYESKRIFLFLPIMFSIMILSNMNAEKSFLLFYLLMTFFYFMYKYKINFKKRYISLLLLLGMFCVVFPTVLLVGTNYPLWIYIIPKIERSFLIPLKVGLWYMHDTQYYGMDWKLVFPNSISNFKVDYANFIGQKYAWYYLTHKTLDSVNANASFIFTFYKGIGIFAIFPSIIGILLLDVFVLTYRKIRKDMLLVLLALMATKCFSFISTNFFTSFFSHGFVFVFLIIGFLSYKKEGSNGMA